MRFGKGGHPSSVVGSYVLVGLCMQLGENLHMQAREPGGLGGGRVLAKRRKGFIFFFWGGKQPPKAIFIGSSIHGGSIDHGGLRIRMSKSYQESQLNLREAQNNFHLFPM